ncbi:MAG: PD40 domain-containing protein [Bacteroidales bacterium]|nr:PD40 domain-containing protein [Bacteroidales bacterium]
MKINIIHQTLVIIVFASLLTGCKEDEEFPPYKRNDSAYQLEISLDGSLQNPAFSPDGESIVFTRFRNGYNEEPADIYIFNLETHNLKQLVSDGSGNVNLPGSCWNETNESIVFSSSREPHDEIYLIDDNGNPGDEIQITDRAEYMAYEPTFSPNGQWVVFESHPLDVEGQGVITKYQTNGSGNYIALTEASDDCRQPNWSPAGNLILYQQYKDNQWDIWVMSFDGSNKRIVTPGPGDKTDASFTSDGNSIVYSTDYDLELANIYKIDISGGEAERLTYCTGYDGAPSISSDGKKLVFESCQGDPDESGGTKIWVLEISN